MWGGRFVSYDRPRKRGFRNYFSIVPVAVLVGLLISAAEAASASFSSGVTAEQNAQFCHKTAGDRSPGITKLCDGLVAAWTAMIPADENDTRVIEIDLGKETVNARAIGRVLAVSPLIPEQYSGGLLIRNGIIDGPLALDHMTKTAGLTFHKIVFEGNVLDRRSIGIPVGDDAKEAISINSSKFTARLIFSESRFGGTLTVARSTLERGLYIFDSVFEEQPSRDSLRIIDSSIKPTFAAIKMHPENGDASKPQVPGLFIENNTFESVEFVGLNFSKRFHFKNNNGNVMKVLRNYFLDDLLIEFNKFDKELAFRKNYIFDQLHIPGISANKIGSRFEFSPAYIHPSTNSIDLSFNRVNGVASIALPPETKAKIDLKNFSATSLLKLVFGDGDETDSFDFSSSNFRRCREGLGGKPPDLIFDLRHGEVGNLNLAIGTNCNRAVMATGLSYQHISLTPHDSVDAWVEMMKIPTSDSLSRVADYLQESGNFSLSRIYRERSKKLDYAKAIPIDDWKKYRFTTHLDDHLFKIIECTQGDTKYNGCIKSYLTVMLLYPGGFGAAPERALKVLFWCWLFFTGIFWFYSRQMFEKIQVNGKFEGLNGKTVPDTFSLMRYSLDTIIPVINLHAYDKYYITSPFWRWTAGLEHIIGWWLVTVFIASVSIL